MWPAGGKGERCKCTCEPGTCQCKERESRPHARVRLPHDACPSTRHAPCRRPRYGGTGAAALGGLPRWHTCECLQSSSSPWNRPASVEEPAVTHSQSLMWEQTQPAPKHLGLGERHRGHGRAWGQRLSVMPGVTRGEAGGRAARCLCVQRGFLLPRTSHSLSISAPESLCPRNLPVCRLGVNSLVGAARAF